MDESYKNNFLESIKAAQKTMFLSCSISLVLYLLATLEKIEKVKLPLVGTSVDAVTGIFVLVIMYLGLGIVFALLTNNARKNFEAIQDQDVKSMLLLNPTLLSGHRFQRFLVSIMPIAMFYTAMFSGFKGDIPMVFFMVFIFSIPYFFATGNANEIKVNQ